MAKKYIDADRLCAEIEKRMHICDGVFERDSDTYYQGKAVAYQETLSLINSLQQEQSCDTCTNDKGCVTCKDGELWEGKGQPCEGYDEAYLNEKIAKASKTWKGVDVDKYMAEMRGYEQPCEDLEVRKQIDELANDWHHKGFASDEDCPLCMRDLIDILWHFYKLGKQAMKEQMPMPEDTVIFQKGIEEGKRLMMENAVEAKGVICKLSDRVWISPVDEEKFHQEVYDRFVIGQTVKIIIVKED